MLRRVRHSWPVLLLCTLLTGNSHAQSPAGARSPGGARGPGIVIIENGRLRDPAPPVGDEEDDAEEAEPASEVGGALVQNACVEAASGQPGSPFIRIRNNVVYGTHPLQALDLYAPASGGPYPILVFIHGGGFSLGDKGPHSRKARAFAEAGYVFVSLNYRLAPAAKHPLPTQDVALALKWLKEHAPEHGGDPRLLFVSGHSAGAHLAALVATDARYLGAQGMHPRDLAGIILLDGAGYDIPARLKRGNKRTWKMYTDAFGSEPAGWRDASPPLQVEFGEELPPFLIFYAGTRPGPRAQALALSSVLEWSGTRVESIHAPDRNHDTIHKKLGSSGDKVSERIFKFLEEERLLRTRLTADNATP